MVVGEILDITPLDATELNEWFVWAGSKLLAMTLSSPFPRSPQSGWPAYATDALEAYGYTNERLRPAIPSKREIDLMDEILGLAALVRDDKHRRIVQCRAIVTPVAQRHLWSFAKIATLLHTNKQNIATWHRKALAEIAWRLPAAKTYAIRQSFASIALLS
jgi:hypothetical protein